MKQVRTGQEGRPRDLRLVIRVMTPLIIAGLAAGAVLEYRRATSDVEQRFSERQAYLARQSADRLSEIFAEVRKFLLVVGQVLEREEARDRGRSLLRTVIDELRTRGAVAAWHQAGAGELLVSVGADPGDLRKLAAAVPACPREVVCLRGPLTAGLTRSGRVVVATLRLPARRAAADRLPGRDSGPALAALGSAGAGAASSIAVVLDWGKLQEVIGRITKLSPDSYAWVLDSEGRLIMHPEHREQLGRDALREKSCARCHSSFDLHREMAQGGSGTGRIQVVGGEPKLVAYTPVAAAGQVWSLAVATPARQVTAKEQGSLLSILLFTGAIMLVMVAGAALLDRESSRRIHATAAFNKELAAKVAERTEEIQALYHRLAGLQAHHTRLERVAVAGEMAAIVAHEIRTPLNALSINAQMIARKLRRGLGEADRVKALESLETLDNEIQRINSLLEDHLLALVRHRPRETRPVCLNETVSEVLRFMEPEAARAQVELLPELVRGLPPVAADPAKLRQVLLNIVLNAIQAMPDGGRVFIGTAADAGMGTVTVRDTGPGIANAIGEVEQVFRPFVTTKEDGTGLGLAICARLVKEMSGKIRVFSQPGEGATFVVAIPLFEPRREQTENGTEREEDVKPCH